MKRPLVAVLLAVAATTLSLPALAGSTPQIGQKDNGFSKLDERYLVTYEDCWKAFKAQCGRNLIDDGLANGNLPSEARIQRSLDTMSGWLNPPEPAPVAQSQSVSLAPTPVAPAYGSSGTPPESIKQCESGGDYGAVNPSSGAYGAWQILPSTSAAYGCDMSTPAGQDACASEIWDGGSGAGQWVCG
jgi:hypothetical protein